MLEQDLLVYADIRTRLRSVLWREASGWLAMVRTGECSKFHGGIAHAESLEVYSSLLYQVDAGYTGGNWTQFSDLILYCSF